MAEFAHDLIWLENRRTPKVVKKGEKYEPTDAEGKIVRRRAANAEEEKTIARGDWVRVNDKGEKPSDDGYKDKKSKVRPGKHTNAGHTATFGLFGDTVFSEYALVSSSDDGYEGVTHAGIAMVAADTGRVLLAQRAFDETDDSEVQETWEFPGGGLGDGEHPWAGALREFGEEVGAPPEGEVVDGWRSPDGVYQAFVYLVPSEVDFGTGADPKEVRAVAWVAEDEQAALNLRPEVEKQTPWDKVFGAVSGNQEEAMAASATEQIVDDEPEYEPGDYDLMAPVPVHGVIAPEELPSGDQRGFAAGAMTRRPLRLPLNDQKAAVGGHDGSVVVGSVDRMMRKDGLIHWEGALMPTPEADDLAGRMEFFDGRFGVSVDGDQGSLDTVRSEVDDEGHVQGTMWFDQVRASGLTAVAIPAFHEAYIAFGPHPEMPADADESDEAESLVASLEVKGDIIGGRSHHFKRGPGWATHPTETRRIHAYWTKKGQPGYAKVGWGTPGDFRRARALIGAKIAEHSPEKMRFINQIIAQWHHDALGYWPGTEGLPGNNPKGTAKRRYAQKHSAQTVTADTQALDTDALVHMLDDEDIEGIEAVDTDTSESVWEAVLVSSAHGERALPPLSYFHRVETASALVIEEPDENGFRRTYGYAGEWGVCHLGMSGRCVEPPRTYSNDYPDFHLGRTKTSEGYVYTGVLTYGVGHRDADTILSETATQAYFDNIKNAWAAVRVGEDERGIWFSGVVLPKVDAADVTKIEASGQVSGEWLRGSLRACLTVNVPGYAVQRASATYDEEGNVLALAASAFASNAEVNGVASSECIQAAADDRLAALRAIAAEERLEALRASALAERIDNLKETV